MRLPLLLTALLSSSLARAGEAVKLEVIRTGQVDVSKPGLVVLPQQAASKLDAKVECGGAWAEHKGSAAAGERILLELAVNPGHHLCKGTLDAVFQDGSSGQMPLSFEIDMYGPLGIKVDKAKVDLSNRKMAVVLDRASSQVEVTVYGLDGRDIGYGDASGGPAGVPVEVSWDQGPGEVIRIVVTGHDNNGYWSALELFPWYYEIPHEDVIFETNQAVIAPEQAYKLEAAWTEVQKVLQKYGSLATVNLYVGGYTDTVGNRQSNGHLSEMRAAAISAWFKGKGFKGAIWFQGFGEDGLAVKTPDEVDEARNRRAVYVLASEAPPVNSQMPGSSWKK